MGCLCWSRKWFYVLCFVIFYDFMFKLCTWVTSTSPQDFPLADVFFFHEVSALSSTHHRSTCIRRCETSSLSAASPTDLEKIGVVYSRRFLPGSFLDTTGQSQLLLPAEVEKGLWWGPLHPFETSPAALNLSSYSFSNLKYSIFNPIWAWGFK